MSYNSVNLCYGFYQDDICVNKVILREINGFDEQYLISIKDFFPSTIRSNKLLERLVTFTHEEKLFKGELSGLLLQNLILGDKILLMLILQHIHFGKKIKCDIYCPKCKKIMSLDILIPDLLKNRFLPENSPENRDNIVDIVSLDNFEVKLRPITISEEYLIFTNSLNRKNQELGFDNQLNSLNHAKAILKSCIISPDPSIVESIPDNYLEKLSKKLEELDPNAEIIFDLQCPYCDMLFNEKFYIEDFFLKEFDMLSRQLENEINWIALNYHWSEHDILTLPTIKRKKYIELINNSLSRGNI